MPTHVRRVKSRPIQQISRETFNVERSTVHRIRLVSCVALLLTIFLGLGGMVAAHADPPQMIFGDDRLLWKAGLLGDFQTTVLPLPPELGFVEADASASKLYVMERSNRFVRRMNLDGSGTEELLSLEQLAQLGIHHLGDAPGEAAIDPVGGKVYWITPQFAPGTQQVTATQISSMNFDGTGQSLVAEVPNRQIPLLWLDAVARRLYRVEAGTGNAPQDIRSSKLDGSDAQHHVAGILSPVAGLYLDHTDQRLYWTTRPAPLADAGLWRAPLQATPVDAGTAEHIVSLGRYAPGRPIIDETDRMLYVMVRQLLSNANRTVPVVKGVDLTDPQPRLETVSSTPSIDFSYAALDLSGRRFLWTDSETLATGQKTGLIWGVDLDGETGPKRLNSSESPSPGGVAFDRAAGNVYWTLPDQGRIRESHIGGESGFSDVLQGLNAPEDVAVDPAGGRLYWSEPHAGAIRRAALDGTGVETFVGGIPGSTIQLAVDVADRTLYWTEPRAIRAIKLDGTGRRTVAEFTGSADQPSGIAVDSRGRQLYWAVRSAGILRRSNLDGTRMRTLVSGLSRPVDVVVDSEGEVLYWTAQSSDHTSGVIQSASIDGTGTETILEGLSPAVASIALGLMDDGTTIPRLTGDVSGDLRVDAYDAALILQYTVGLISSFPVDDMVGTAPENQTPRHYAVRLPHLSARPGQRVTVPVTLDHPADFLSGAMSLSYDTSVLRAHRVHMSLNGTYWQANIASEGEVRIAFASFDSLPTDDTLFVMEFDVLSATPGRRGDIVVDDVALSNSLSVQTSVGWVELAPEVNALLPNYPNPFNPETWIPYHLSESASVRIHIYDLAGNLVRALEPGWQPAGVYLGRDRAAHWDGRNRQGEPVASGVYFYELRAGDHRATRLMSIRK